MKGFFCLIFVSLMLPVLGNEPGGAAIAFLEKVRDGGIDLAPGGDTALQDNTTEAKRQTIRKHLERLGEDLKGGKFVLGEVKEDEGFAAVMVSRIGGFDSAQLQAVPVALVRDGAEWLPAPIPASFENAVAGYSVSLRKRLGDLEDWMSKRRVTDLNKLIAEAAERTRSEIRENIIGEDLEADDLGKLTDRFLDACVNGNRAAVLGFLGGLSDPLPDDWSRRLQASALVTESTDDNLGAWRLLTSPDVVRVRVLEEKMQNSGLVSIACLDPSRAGSRGTLGKIEVLHFEFTRDKEGRWRIDLPEGLLLNDVKELAVDDDLDVDLLDSFPRELRALEPIIGEDTAEKAKAAVMAGLRSGGLRALLSRVDFSGRPKDARIAAAAAAETWWSMNDAGAFHFPVELGFKQEGALAAAVYQWFSPMNADRFEARTLYFKKIGDGWVWAPGVVSVGEREAQKTLSAWAKDGLADWRISWRETLLKPSVKIEAIGFGKLASDAEVEALIGNWLAALDDHDIGAVLGLSAWLGVEREIPMKALRNISYDLSVARRSKVEFESVYRSDSWVAAAISREMDGEVRHSFLPVLMTPEGPRILPEVDLVAGNNRTRKFLNEASFERLERIADGEKKGEFEALFGKFEKTVKVD